MDDEAYVAFVDAHAEGGGGHDDFEFAGHEGLLGLAWRGSDEDPGVVDGREERRVSLPSRSGHLFGSLPTWRLVMPEPGS